MAPNSHAHTRQNPLKSIRCSRPGSGHPAADCAAACHTRRSERKNRCREPPPRTPEAEPDTQDHATGWKNRPAPDIRHSLRNRHTAAALPEHTLSRRDDNRGRNKPAESRNNPEPPKQKESTADPPSPSSSVLCHEMLQTSELLNMPPSSNTRIPVATSTSAKPHRSNKNAIKIIVLHHTAAATSRASR